MHVRGYKEEGTTTTPFDMAVLNNVDRFQLALDVIDMAMQLHGGAGMSDDTPLAFAWAGARCLRLADGPDEVHRGMVARLELKKYV